MRPALAAALGGFHSSGWTMMTRRPANWNNPWRRIVRSGSGTIDVARMRAALWLTLALAALAGPCGAQGLAIDIEAFIHAMVYKHGFNRRELRKTFREVQPKPEVLSVAAAGARPWREFRAATVTRERIDSGVKFWGIHEKVLDRVSAEYGVPREIIVATIGVKSQYGHRVGGFRAIDVLTTLAFQHKRRADFYRGELEEYLLLARETGLDPLRIRGSESGAIGIPQFLPSAYRKYARDLDGNGKPDLVNSVPDAVASIANDYRANGWKAGEPVAVRAEVSADALSQVTGTDLQPRTTVADLQQKGVKPLAPLAGTLRAAPFWVETKDGKEYWLGLDNFHVMSRDPRGVNHALAVHELAQELRAAKR
jgi:membrane-bound lytic murein transglycosylase B